MARKINIEIKEENNVKKYVVEYNRYSILKMGETTKDLKKVGLFDMLKCGLYMHHEKEMPSDEEIKEIMAYVDDIEGFIKALKDCISEGLDPQKKLKNVKWGLN